MPVVAYCVTSHTLPGQVLRLLRAIRELSPAAPVLLHHDGRREPLDRRAAAAIGGVHLIPPVPAVEWGRGSQLDMWLRCLRYAVTEVGFDWLVQISGQDFPARPLEAVERELAATPFDGFVEGHLVEAPALSRAGAGDEFSRRYFLHWRRVPDPGRALRRAVAAARPLLALRELPSGVVLGHRARTPFSAAMPCRRGVDWLTLNRRCAELVARAARERRDLVRHFRRTVLPTEAFAHTVLHAEPGLRLSGEVRRHMRWLPGSPHPEILGVGDLEAILTSGTDFARKFDERADGAVLDALERTLGITGVPWIGR